MNKDRKTFLPRFFQDPQQESPNPFSGENLFPVPGTSPMSAGPLPSSQGHLSLPGASLAVHHKTPVKCPHPRASGRLCCGSREGPFGPDTEEAKPGSASGSVVAVGDLPRRYPSGSTTHSNPSRAPRVFLLWTPRLDGEDKGSGQWRGRHPSQPLLLPQAPRPPGWDSGARATSEPERGLPVVPVP